MKTRFSSGSFFYLKKSQSHHRQRENIIPFTNCKTTAICSHTLEHFHSELKLMHWLRRVAVKLYVERCPRRIQCFSPSMTRIDVSAEAARNCWRPHTFVLSSRYRLYIYIPTRVFIPAYIQYNCELVRGDIRTRSQRLYANWGIRILCGRGYWERSINVFLDARMIIFFQANL